MHSLCHRHVHIAPRSEAFGEQQLRFLFIRLCLVLRGVHTDRMTNRQNEKEVDTMLFPRITAAPATFTGPRDVLRAKRELISCGTLCCASFDKVNCSEPKSWLVWLSRGFAPSRRYFGVACKLSLFASDEGNS